LDSGALHGAPLSVHAVGRRRSGKGWRPAAVLWLVVLLAWRPAGAHPLYLEALRDFERYAEGVWRQATHAGAPPQTGYWGDGNSSGNGGIRGSCGIAVAYATLVYAEPDSAENARRMDRLRQALDYAAETHLTGSGLARDGRRWGHGWQTAMWAGSMGLACLLVEDRLPSNTVARVRRVVADECDHRAGIPPASGYVSDTKSEENGWNSNVLALGAAWLSDHPRAPIWLEAAKRYLVNTYTVPDSSADPLAARITTATLYPSYALENHGFFHPTYQMVGGMSLGDSLLMARLANPAVAAELQPFAEHNVLEVWHRVLAPLLLDSGDFAYPAGLDWELHDFEHNSYLAWLATHFDDPVARWAHERVAQLVRYRQRINGDGSFVGPSGGGFYREAVEARRTAIAWLHSRVNEHPTGTTAPPADVVLHLPDVQVLHLRSARGSFSVSYKPDRVMAVVEPAARSVPEDAFVSTPRRPGILGLGTWGPPTGATLLGLEMSSNHFDALLALTNGAAGWTLARVFCDGESFALVEVPHPLGGGGPADPGSFVCGIENDPLTGGARALAWPGGIVWITNRSGLTVTVTNPWVCVADRFGVAAGPAGWFEYRAATDYNIPGAAEDTLRFIPVLPAGPRYAVWIVGRAPAELEAWAAQIGWETRSNTARLSWRGRNDQVRTLEVALPRMPAFPPYAVAPVRGSASSTQGTYTFDRTLDGRADTFWVSLYGPTNRAEWLWVAWDREVALSGATLLPRTDNGGYGPSRVRFLANVPEPVPGVGPPEGGQLLYEGSVPPDAPLQLTLDPPVRLTNAIWVLLGAYDRGNTNQPRNVQVAELTFTERARPGTYGDWVLHAFPPSAREQPENVDPQADPDQDRSPNLVEYVAGTDPLDPESVASGWSPGRRTPDEVSWVWGRRVETPGLTETILTSTNLVDWTPAEPLRRTPIVSGEGREVWEVAFPIEPGARFYQLRYQLQFDR